jgi:hypothetical protein
MTLSMSSRRHSSRLDPICTHGRNNVLVVADAIEAAEV